MNRIKPWIESLGLHAWVIEVFIIVFVTLVLELAVRVTLARLERRLSRTRNLWDNTLVEAVSRPAHFGVWAVGLSIAFEVAVQDLASPLRATVGVAREVAVITLIAWFLMRFIRMGQARIIEQRRHQQRPVDYTAVDAVAKLLRLTVAITALLVILQTLGFSVAGVLTFGGIGGIAIGFAARDLLANFFGGFMVYMDRPFSVGDWIRSPDREIEGTVEDIGWRITRIRTFDSRPLYVPNATFANIALENPSRMHHRRIHETIGIRYADGGSMGAIVADVEAMLRAHEGIAAEQTLMVNFTSFAPSSLDFFIYCFTRTVQWAEYHSIKQDVLLQVLEIVARHDAEVALPTSTVHLAGEAQVAAGSAGG